MLQRFSDDYGFPANCGTIFSSRLLVGIASRIPALEQHDFVFLHPHMAGMTRDDTRTTLLQALRNVHECNRALIPPWPWKVEPALCVRVSRKIIFTCPTGVQSAGSKDKLQQT